MSTIFDTVPHSPTGECYCTAMVSNSHAKRCGQETNDNREGTVEEEMHINGFVVFIWFRIDPSIMHRSFLPAVKVDEMH